MNILAAILVLGASGSAERSMESNAKIYEIVAQCGYGAFSDVYGRRNSGDGKTIAGTISDRLSDAGLLLTIDGHPRTGWRSWGEAAWRVGGYAADCRDDGSVGYSYRLRIRGYLVRRGTRITDEHIVLTTDAWWTEVVPVGRSTRRIPIHVTITVSASERRGSPTLLVGQATGTADTSDFRCGLVRRIADNAAHKQLDASLERALLAIQERGVAFYAGGSDIAGVLDRIHTGIEIGTRLRRR